MYKTLTTLVQPVTEGIKKPETKVSTLSSSSLSPPKSLKDSPFVTRLAEAFDELKESREGGVELSSWAEDSDLDKETRRPVQ